MDIFLDVKVEGALEVEGAEGGGRIPNVSSEVGGRNDEQSGCG